MIAARVLCSPNYHTGVRDATHFVAPKCQPVDLVYPVPEERQYSVKHILVALVEHICMCKVVDAAGCNLMPPSSTVRLLID